MEPILGAVAAVCAIFGACLGWRRLRKDQKDARVNVLEETIDILKNNRDELKAQNERQEKELVLLRNEVDSLKAAIKAVNQLVTAEASVAELRGIVTTEFENVKRMIRELETAS